MFFHFFDVFSVQVFNLRTLILPFVNNFVFCSFSPLNFVVVHVLLKSFLPSRHKINFSNNFVRNTTQIKKYNDKIRLFTTRSNLFFIHNAVVIYFVFMTVFDKILSILNECSNIIELRTVTWIRKNIIPWGS